MMRFAARALGYAVLYLVVTLVVAVLAHGWDLDQLTSRSAVSRAAAFVEPGLWLVQTLIFSAVPTGRISEYRWVIPVALVANMLAYGVLLAAVHSLAMQRRSRVR